MLSCCNILLMHESIKITVNFMRIKLEEYIEPT